MRLAPLIDHTLLHPAATEEQIDRLCDEVRQQGFATACVAGRWASRAAYRLDGSESGLCVVVNFPHGNSSPLAAVKEAALAIADGADELDTVLPLGDFFDRRDRAVVDLIRDLSSLGAPLKVILETSLLSDEQIVRACLLAEEGGAAFVKTSTGFAGGGATVRAVELMHQTVGGRLGVKASGGIRTRAQALELVQAGATRLGASASLALIQGDD